MLSVKYELNLYASCGFVLVFKESNKLMVSETRLLAE